MTNSHIALRTTADPNILELEVVVWPPVAEASSFERILTRHQLRCVYRYVVHTGVRTIVRAKLAGEGYYGLTFQMMNLLDDLRRHFVEEFTARAA